MPASVQHHALTKGRELTTLLVLCAVQFTHILDFMIMMPLGGQLMRVFDISPAQFTHLLARVHRDFRVAGDYLASLPIAGADGTLRSRLQDTGAERFVRAKTGSLDQISTLSGYAGAVGKPPIAFSILLSGLDKWKAPLAKQAQDQIAAVLAAEAAARP